MLGHYLFLEAHSFPRASLSENCSLLGTDNVRGQISEHIFAPNEGYIVYIFMIYGLPSTRKRPAPNWPDSPTGGALDQHRRGQGSSTRSRYCLSSFRNCEDHAHSLLLLFFFFCCPTKMLFLGVNEAKLSSGV